MSGSGAVRPINNGGRFSINGQTLTISNIQPEDEGQYRCNSSSLPSGVSAGCLIVSGESGGTVGYGFSYCTLAFNKLACTLNNLGYVMLYDFLIPNLRISSFQDLRIKPYIRIQSPPN